MASTMKVLALALLFCPQLSTAVCTSTHGDAPSCSPDRQARFEGVPDDAVAMLQTRLSLQKVDECDSHSAQCSTRWCDHMEPSVPPQELVPSDYSRVETTIRNLRTEGYYFPQDFCVETYFGIVPDPVAGGTTEGEIGVCKRPKVNRLRAQFRSFKDTCKECRCYPAGTKWYDLNDARLVTLFLTPKGNANPIYWKKLRVRESSLTFIQSEHHWLWYQEKKEWVHDSEEGVWSLRDRSDQISSNQDTEWTCLQHHVYGKKRAREFECPEELVTHF